MVRQCSSGFVNPDTSYPNRKFVAFCRHDIVEIELAFCVTLQSDVWVFQAHFSQYQPFFQQRPECDPEGEFVGGNEDVFSIFFHDGHSSEGKSRTVFNGKISGFIGNTTSDGLLCSHDNLLLVSVQMMKLVENYQRAYENRKN